MARFGPLQGAGGVALGAGAALVLALAGLVLSTRLLPDAAEDTAVIAGPEAGNSEDIVGALPGARSERRDAAGAPVPEADVASPAPSDAGIADISVPASGTETAQNSSAAIVPSFDIVRAQPDGETLVAGIAEPNGSVDVLIDGVLADTVDTDASGRFVSFLSIAEGDMARVLTLRIASDSGPVESADQVILAPSSQIARADTAPVPRVTAIGDAASLVLDGSGDEPSETTAETGASVSGPEGPQAIADAGALSATGSGRGDPANPAPRDPATTSAPDGRQAPAVILSGRSGIEVLQSPTDPASRPQIQSNVALDAITYEEDGAVVLTGRGRVDDSVRIYLDNRPVTTSRIVEDGRWRATLPQVSSGTYTLRIDQLGPEGSVTSRVESPFLRETPDTLAAAAALAGSADVRAVTVQPGNTLWAIARDRYGEGLAYVRVFEANRDAIRNPDLIYPGQVFTIPN